MPARRSERIAARGDANGSPTNESNTGPVVRVRRGTNSRDQSDRPRGGRAAPRGRRTIVRPEIRFSTPVSCRQRHLNILVSLL